MSQQGLSHQTPPQVRPFPNLSINQSSIRANSTSETVKPTMSYPIEYVTESDAPVLGEINNLAFGNRLMLPRMFPSVSPSILSEYKAKNVMKHLANPETHVLKVSDPATGQIVGYSRWHFPTQLGIPPVVPPLSEQAQEYAKDPVVFAPESMRKDVYTAFKTLLEETRKRNVTEKDMSESLSKLPRLFLLIVSCSA